MDHRATLDRYSSNLPGEPTRADGGGGKLHFGAALIHPLGVSMYSVRRVPAWPSTYPFPQGKILAIFFCCLLMVCFRPLPFRTIAHTLVRTVSPALCRFARSDTPWPQGSRTDSAQQKFHMPWAHGPANIIAYPIDFASQLPP